ncbi:hypothetical protein [Aminipila terrae]|uniref:Uncharacterized protein n=1 Tax=Aminipila terrae TaxID=2697030 RepID=A0A6P1MHP8_9FIRM|nr:hypothetical protein [Aminipila terrae]QHI73261.1 hypothetical protein Ami3637_13520 [Aminipila terrae]
MEVEVDGNIYIVNESYEIPDKERREQIIAEKLASIIVIENHRELE